MKEYIWVVSNALISNNVSDHLHKPPRARDHVSTIDNSNSVHLSGPGVWVSIFNFLFGNDYRFTGGYKEMCREDPGTLPPASHKVSILHKPSIIPKLRNEKKKNLRNGHWYNIATDLIQILPVIQAHVCVCAYVTLCNFTTCTFA